MGSSTSYPKMLARVVDTIDAARSRVVAAANSAMTACYWDIGRRVVSHQEHGASRAAYGAALLERLSGDLTRRFGRGFSVDNLENARRFYLAFRDRQISETPSRKSLPAKSETPPRNSSARFPLAWSHYALLVRRVDRPEAIAFYEHEALRGGWTVRQLERQVASQFYERTALSRDKAAVRRAGAKALPGEAMTPEEQIKDPFVLEFLSLKDEYSENDLEEALIVQLEAFLLELGSDFTFIGRQRRLRIGSQWYRVDLLLFHRRLRCLVVIDLKLGHFTHADAGQMHLYLNYARENWTLPGENPPIGLILCTSKDDAVVRYALDGLSNKVLATEYRTALPEERLIAAAMKKSRRRLEAASGYVTSRKSFSSAAWSPRANASSASKESRSR